MSAFANYCAQAAAGERLMAEYLAYAARIGCTLIPPDGIQCDSAQAGALAKWWTQHTGRPAPPYVPEETKA